MQFFDDKQDVMDVVITPFGKHLLSQGRFKPEYYAFFDDDILYDARWAPGETLEVQNTIEERIQQGTPRKKQPAVRTGVEPAINIRSDLINEAIAASPDDLDVHVVQDTQNHKIYNQESLQIYGDRFDFLKSPLGQSAISSDYMPAWNISMLTGQISSSQDYTASVEAGIERIPQLNVDLNYKIYVSEMSNEYDWTPGNPTVNFGSSTFLTPCPDTDEKTEHGYDNFPPELIKTIASEIFEDGTYFSMEDGKIILEISEENVLFKKENFDIQVFVSSSVFPAFQGNPQQLFFTNNDGGPQNDDVEKYLAIRVDKEIDDARITHASIDQANSLTTDRSTTNVVSTREFLVRDLYDPEEDICE